MVDLSDVVIIGAGAAGLMTAVTCGRAGAKVLLLDGKAKIGAKILMSGGTRCNVTNVRVTEKDFETSNKTFVRHVLAAYPEKKAVEFFTGLGVGMILEEGGKYFPSTHSGRTILEAFQKELGRARVLLKTSHKVQSVFFEKERFVIRGADFAYESKTIVLTAGGLSYPATGSDGGGYEIAKSFGHTLVFTTPALTPLQTGDPDWQSLAGVSLPAVLSFGEEGEKKISFEGSFLFTHSGFSGPVVLNISRHWIRSQSPAKKLVANFFPECHEENFPRFLDAAAKKNPRRLVKKFLAESLPERFVEILLKKSGIGKDLVLNQFKRGERLALSRLLFRSPLEVTGCVGYEKAEVTAGGVDLAEMDYATLESKLRPGLFFAGEILDADGRIGGFNFQWAWSTGVLAARGAVRKLKSEDRSQRSEKEKKSPRIFPVLCFLSIVSLVFLQPGCASLFGWDIHAPGILSGNFAHRVQPIEARVALYLPKDLYPYLSTARGGIAADPQTYHVGEALAPMLVEAFQDSFTEFIFMETEPSPEIMRRYGISYLAVVRIKDFSNRVTWKGRAALTLVTETVILDPDLNSIARFESRGSSGAEKVFVKKGGPQVNLNSAIENNILAIIEYLQDALRQGSWR